MTNEEKKKVEDLVNGWVDADLQVKKEIMILKKDFQIQLELKVQPHLNTQRF